MRVVINEKHFGDKKIFSNLDLKLEEGGRYVVRGSSGRGKTTLMRMILSLDRDYLGYIEDPPKQPIAVFQEDRLIPFLTVGANLEAVSKDKERCKELLSAIGLSGEYNSPIESLSGGMKRRVCIVRALLMEYDWLLLDEPFEGLDEDAKKRSIDLILSSSKGKGIILITHSDEDADLIDGTVLNI